MIEPREHATLPQKDKGSGPVSQGPGGDAIPPRIPGPHRLSAGVWTPPSIISHATRTPPPSHP